MHAYELDFSNLGLKPSNLVDIQFTALKHRVNDNPPGLVHQTLKAEFINPAIYLFFLLRWEKKRY